jgi:hypothetical protein
MCRALRCRFANCCGQPAHLTRRIPHCIDRYEALMLLGAVSLVSLVLAPVAAAAALRLALE